MKKNIILLYSFVNCIISVTALGSQTTQRMTEFSNDKVNVWKTIIYPGKSQTLKMHQHENDRVLIALDKGVLKIKNDKNKVHYLKLEKNRAYYLKKDIPDTLHSDENISKHPIQVLVVELKK